MKVLELYSGIGGMHYALNESGIPHKVVAAADINTTANRIYQQNFPDTKLITKSIESITVKDFNKLNIDMILMSPPCQPFCRVGKQRDVSDVRSKSFLYLLSTLPKLDHIPNYILVENVKGFDSSESRQMLLNTLRTLRYHVQEFLLSPLQFGIPNSRLRYYLIAKRASLTFNFTTTPEFRHDIPQCVDSFLVHKKDSNNLSADQNTSLNRSLVDSKEFTCNCLMCESDDVTTRSEHENTNTVTKQLPSENKDTAIVQSETKNNTSPDDRLQCSESETPLHEKYQHICNTIGQYLEKENDDYFQPYLVPEKFFKRYWVMDFVRSESKNSCCFTKRYAHHMEGAGSVIEMNSDAITSNYFKTKHQYCPEVHEAVRMRKLRFFSPREIANLMCFPTEFGFPSDINNIQMYRVLGNSLNVHVVSILIRLLTFNDCDVTNSKNEVVKRKADQMSS